MYLTLVYWLYADEIAKEGVARQVLRFKIFMVKKLQDSITEEDSELFANAVKNITPLAHHRVILKKKSKPPLVRAKQEKSTATFHLTDHSSEPDVCAQDQLFFAVPGVSPKQLINLKKGKFPIEATLDLHGFDSDSARTELTNFIDHNYQSKKRYVRIVHGKGHQGKPVLKNRLNNWLRQIDTVLAFTSAVPKHGGTGAVYVLIKSSSK